MTRAQSGTSSLSGRRCRSVIAASALGAAALLAPAMARGQALGPQRQLLALEPYYVNVQLDQGSALGRLGLNGLGARLWLNLAPFGIGHTGLGLFGQRTFAKDGITTWHYGAEFDLYPVNYPFLGRIDPFVSLGAGALSTSVDGAGLGGMASVSSTRFALTPGVGIRIPLTNRLQLRGDARDAVVFASPNGAGSSRTTNNLEFLGGIGLTF